MQIQQLELEIHLKHDNQICVTKIFIQGCNVAEQQKIIVFHDTISPTNKRAFLMYV